MKPEVTYGVHDGGIVWLYFKHSEGRKHLRGGKQSKTMNCFNFICRLKFPLLFHCITVSGSGRDSLSGIGNLLTLNPNFLLTSISISISSMNPGTMGQCLASSLAGGSDLGLTCRLDWVWTCSSGSSSLSGTSGCSRCLWVQEKEEEDV